VDYLNTELMDLMDQIAEQGGEHMDRTCVSREFEFVGPHSKPITLRYCNNDTVFAIPYEALDKEGREAGLQPVEVCAVEDNVGMWPRFGGDRFAHILPSGEDADG